MSNVKVNECPYIPFATEGMIWTVASVPSAYESMSYAEEPVWQPGRIVVAELADATYCIVLCTGQDVASGHNDLQHVSLATTIHDHIHFSSSENDKTVCMTIYIPTARSVRYTFIFETSLDFLGLVRVFSKAKTHLAAVDEEHTRLMALVRKTQFRRLPAFDSLDAQGPARTTNAAPTPGAVEGGASRAEAPPAEDPDVPIAAHRGRRASAEGWLPPILEEPEAPLCDIVTQDPSEPQDHSERKAFDTAGVDASIVDAIETSVSAAAQHKVTDVTGVEIGGTAEVEVSISDAIEVEIIAAAQRKVVDATEDEVVSVA